MSKTAIVIGASGLVGGALVDELLAHPAFSRVTCITRQPLALKHDKLHNTVVDFEALDSVAEKFRGDCLFSCLGTTRKQAGSIAAQRRVDLDYQLTAARLAKQLGVSHYLLVSAMGASQHSANAYMKMKGELEEQVTLLGFARTSIFQPSLLTGQRAQKRTMEDLSAPLMGALCKLPPLRKFRPISGAELARAMRQCSLRDGKGLKRYTLQECFPVTE